MVIGQHNPKSPFNREPLELTAYFLDGSETTIEFRDKEQFFTAWQNLDHPNLISVVLLQKATYGIKYDRRAEETRHYRLLIFTNDSEFTHYWMDEDGFELQEGNSADIPIGASAFPKNERASTIDIDNKAGRKYVVSA